MADNNRNRKRKRTETVSTNAENERVALATPQTNGTPPITTSSTTTGKGSDRAWKNADGTSKKGKYSPDEDEKLRNAVRNYVGSKGWAYEIGVERLLSKQRDPELRRAWLIISESLPDRSVESLYYRASRLLGTQKKGVWDEDEERILRQAVENGNLKWSELAKRMNRSETSIRDKYREMKKKNHGPWSNEDTEWLAKQCEASSVNSGKIPWVAIADKLGRSESQCRKKWRDLNSSRKRRRRDGEGSGGESPLPQASQAAPPLPVSTPTPTVALAIASPTQRLEGIAPPAAAPTLVPTVPPVAEALNPGSTVDVRQRKNRPALPATVPLPVRRPRPVAPPQVNFSEVDQAFIAGLAEFYEGDTGTQIDWEFVKQRLDLSSQQLSASEYPQKWHALRNRAGIARSVSTGDALDQMKQIITRCSS